MTISDHSSDADPAVGVAEWPYQVLKRMRLIFKAVQQHSQWVETQCGVTSAQLWAMWEIARRPGLKVSDVAAAMSIHQSTASNLLDKLSRKGYVTRSRVSRDQRVVTLTLTREGEDVLARAPATPQGILQHALFNLPEDKLQALAGLLDLLIQEMEIKDEEAAMQPLTPLFKPSGTRRSG